MKSSFSAWLRLLWVFFCSYAPTLIFIFLIFDNSRLVSGSVNEYRSISYDISDILFKMFLFSVLVGSVNIFVFSPIKGFYKYLMIFIHVIIGVFITFYSILAIFNHPL